MALHASSACRFAAGSCQKTTGHFALARPTGESPRRATLNITLLVRAAYQACFEAKRESRCLVQVPSCGANITPARKTADVAFAPRARRKLTEVIDAATLG